MVNSSYKQNNYRYEFLKLCFKYEPKNIIEFGILDGYSLGAFVDYAKETDCRVSAFDLFDEYEYNHANWNLITSLFKHTKAQIFNANFYTSVDKFKDDSIDMLHIDISNDGDTYEFAIKNYLDKLTKHGVMLLEGGTHERDNIDWMKRYGKRSICSVMDEYRSRIYFSEYYVIHKFPGLTVIRK